MDINQFIDFDFRKKWLQTVGNIFLLSVFGVILLKVGDMINNAGLKSVDFLTKSPEPIRIAAFFVYLILFFGLLKISFRYFSQMRKKGKVYKFKNQDWPDKWIFNGRTEAPARINELHVKSSRAGCLLKEELWQDFRMSFKMKFAKTSMKRIGIIFRAQDLENYFMLEIFREDYGSSNGVPSWASGIKPHIRYKGGWEVTDSQNYKHELDFSNLTPVVLEVKDKTVNFFYKRKKVFEWVLPTHVDVNFIEAGFNQDTKTTPKDIIGKEVSRNVSDLTFRTAYGMVGFRAHPGQEAIIRDLKIETL